MDKLSDEYERTTKMILIAAVSLLILGTIGLSVAIFFLVLG